MRFHTLAVLASGAAALAHAAGYAPAFGTEPETSPDQLSWAQSERHWSSSERLKLQYFSSLVITGQLDLLEQEMARHPLRGKFAAQRTKFFTAAILRRRGKKKEAVRIYREILAQQPHLEKVRAELAATLYELEDDDAAKHHLNRLLSSNANDGNREVFKNLLDHIDQRRPWQLGGYLTLAPSSNYKKGSRHKTVAVGPFTLNIDNQEESGIGLRGGAYGSYTHRFGEGLSAIAAGSVAHSEYPGQDFDDTQLSGNLELRKTHGPAYYGVGVTASRRWLGGEGQSHSVGPRITLKHPISRQVMLRTTFDYQEKRYDDATYLNGRDFSINMRTTIGMGADQALFLINGGTRAKTRLDHNDYWSGYAGLGFYKEWPLGITTYTEGRFSHYYYDGRYPNKFAPRRDQRFSFVASVTKRDWNFMGFAPKLEYTMTHGISNVEFFEFTEHGTNLTVTRDF